MASHFHDFVKLLKMQLSHVGISWSTTTSIVFHNFVCCLNDFKTVMYTLSVIVRPTAQNLGIALYTLITKISAYFDFASQLWPCITTSQASRKVGPWPIWFYCKFRNFKCSELKKVRAYLLEILAPPQHNLLWGQSGKRRNSCWNSLWVHCTWIAWLMSLL